MFNSILKALQTVSEVPLYPDDSMMSSICHTVNSHTVKKTKKEKKKVLMFCVTQGLYFLSLFKAGELHRHHK